MKQIIRTAMIIWVLAAASANAVNVQVQPDGRYYAPVLVHGSSTVKYDLVFIGDGFTSTQQDTFNTSVNEAVVALQARWPYSERMCGFNIWRVNVVSAESGIDHPAQGIFRNTELDCRYGDPSVNEAERCVRSDSPAKCYEAADYAPDYDAVFVLVNDTQPGGCAGAIVYSAITPGFAGILTHELGHRIGPLADEYECYVCNGTDSNRTYTGPEPTAINITTETERASIKWASLIDPATPIPTTVNSPAGVVGLWEGGGYYRYGIYRPQFECHMRGGGVAFCTVCGNRVFSRLDSRCTACEINPTSFYCLFGDLLDQIRFRYDALVDWRWPLPPPCLACSFSDVLDQGEVRLVIKGVPDGFSLRVVDDQGDLIASSNGVVKDGQAVVSFRAIGDRQYFAEMVSSPQYAPTGQEVNLSIELFRNETAQPLPAGQ
jgi:hypothetical protein